jgi:DNA polymerase III delta subunit
MIFIIHGENNSKSREVILQLQKKLNRQNKKEVNITETSANQLLDLGISYDIFSEAPFIVFDITGTNQRNFDDYIEVLKKIPEETVVVIYTTKELTKANAFIKSATVLKAKIMQNQPEFTPSVFKFTDALFSKDKNNAYREYRNLTLADDDAFYIFSMVLYGLRNVAHVKFKSPSYSKMAPFIKMKAQKQAEKFTEEEIKENFTTCYRLDKDLKTGKISPQILIPYLIEKIAR